MTTADNIGIDVFTCCLAMQLNITIMKLGPGILKILDKTYPPSAMCTARFKNIDLAFKTDVEGRPVLLFIGKLDATGNVTGERFVRTLKTPADGVMIKDHWEHKGKAT